MDEFTQAYAELDQAEADYHAAQAAARPSKIWYKAMSLISHAKKRRPTTITLHEIEDRIAAGKCEVTGIPFDLGKSRHGGRVNPFSPSLDRRDPKLGYTPENTQVVIFVFNMAKAEMNQKDAIRAIRYMAAHLPTDA